MSSGPCGEEGEGGIEQTIGLVLPILLTLSMRNPEPATVTCRASHLFVLNKDFWLISDATPAIFDSVHEFSVVEKKHHCLKLKV